MNIGSDDWLTVVVIILTGIMLAAAFYLIWRGIVEPGTLAKMEARLDRHRVIMDEQQAEINELREAMTADREELAEMRIEMAEWRAGMRMVFEQMKTAGITPVWKPRARPAYPRRNKTDAPLVDRIAAAFNIDEMNNLAYSVGVGVEDFGGETRHARARELVDAARRRNLLDRLIEICRTERPEGGF